MNNEHIAYRIITKSHELEQMAAELENEKAIGVDLESDSMFHYSEKVCLLQISTQTKNFLVDTVALKDLSLMKKIFRSKEILKVFHGADYDIRSLNRDFAIVVNNLFDTQIAARLLGFREYSLSHLLKQLLGVVIEKKYQKKDWSKRPLTAAMLDYAAKDSCNLLNMHRILERQLVEKGRISWAEEESRILSKVRPHTNTNNQLFTNFRGAGKLAPRSLAVLEAILQFREGIAKRFDVPCFKILGNKQIMELSKKQPTTKKALKATNCLSPKQLNSFETPLLKIINNAQNIPENKCPAYPNKAAKSFDPMATKRIKALRLWRDSRAAELDIEPSLVCTNLQIQLLATKYPQDIKDVKNLSLIKDWQSRVFGMEIVNLLKSTG